MNLSSIKKFFSYLLIFTSITLLSLIIFTNFSNFDYKSYIQKYKYKISRTSIADLKSDETNIRNSKSDSIKIKNIRRKENLKAEKRI